jgi:AbrB family looped-hinge helix DNA binding protein
MYDEEVVISHFPTMSLRGVLTLPLVKVKEKFQITLPAELREKLNLAVGDILEATTDGKTIVLKPKAVIDRAEAWQRVIDVMDRVHANLPPSTQDPIEEEKEIARMVKEYRKQHAARRD